MECIDHIFHKRKHVNEPEEQTFFIPGKGLQHTLGKLANRILIQVERLFETHVLLAQPSKI